MRPILTSIVGAITGLVVGFPTPSDSSPSLPPTAPLDGTVIAHDTMKRQITMAADGLGTITISYSSGTLWRHASFIERDGAIVGQELHDKVSVRPGDRISVFKPVSHDQNIEASGFLTSSRTPIAL